MGKKPYYRPGSMASRAAGSMRYAACGKKSTGKKKAASKKTIADKEVTEVKTIDEVTLGDVDKEQEQMEQAAEPAITRTYSGKVSRPSEETKKSFVIAVQDGKNKVMHKGTQLECLGYIAKLVEAHPKLNLDVYIATGVRIIGN